MRVMEGFYRRLTRAFKLRLHHILESGVFARIKVVGRDFMPAKLSTPKKTMSKLLTRMNGRLLLTLSVLICVSCGLGVIAASQWSSTIVGSHGNLRVDGVGVFEDANCSAAVKNLDWGTVEPGSVINIALYVRNEGNHAATLFLATNGWNPTNASDYISLSWDYKGETINPTESVKITLTLSVSPNVEARTRISDFSFQVVIGTS